MLQGENETNRETEADLKYPSIPSWEVQVMNDSGEFETMLVPRSKHVPYVPWTGGPVICLGCACLYFAFSFLC